MFTVIFLNLKKTLHKNQKWDYPVLQNLIIFFLDFKIPR